MVETPQANLIRMFSDIPMSLAPSAIGETVRWYAVRNRLRATRAQSWSDVGGVRAVWFPVDQVRLDQLMLKPWLSFPVDSK